MMDEARLESILEAIDKEIPRIYTHKVTKPTQDEENEDKVTKSSF